MILPRIGMNRKLSPYIITSYHEHYNSSNADTNVNGHWQGRKKIGKVNK
jgi:hypothetical protein